MGDQPLDLSQVIVDDCHRIPAHEMALMVSRFPAHYLLGLSAIRNELIRSRAHVLTAHGRTCLVLTDRPDHAQLLHALLSEADSTALLREDCSPVHRERNRNAINHGEITVLVTIYSAIDENCNAPRLDTLILASPPPNKGRLVHNLRLIIVPAAEKDDALVIDFIDENRVLWRQCRKRWSVYLALGCEVREA